MSAQRYQRVRFAAISTCQITNIPSQVAETDPQNLSSTSPNDIHRSTPSSPPPSFRSHDSSPRTSTHLQQSEVEAERLLEDAFGGPPSEDEDDDDNHHHRHPTTTSYDADVPSTTSQSEPLATSSHTRPATSDTRIHGGGSGTRDGVFANISATSARDEEVDEKPPVSPLLFIHQANTNTTFQTYEQSQQDPTPPYWETTILTPGGFNSDDVFVDGLLVGSLFSFVWNALISMSFQLIGFLLTYLLHTTHAAKHGSRAGLGITLIQYGFAMRGAPPMPSEPPGHDKIPSVPADPNEHNFDPDDVVPDASAGFSSGDTGGWLSYVLIIAGWLLLIKGTSDFVRARRQEQLVRASPERGLNVPVVAVDEGENAV